MKDVDDPGDVPAVVHYLAGRRAWIWHPAGPGHENVVRTIARLQRRGYSVVSGPDADVLGTLKRTMTGETGSVAGVQQNRPPRMRQEARSRPGAT